MSSGRRRAVLTLSGQTGLQGRSWPSLRGEPRRPSPLSVRWGQDLVSTGGQGLPLTWKLEDKASPDSRGPTAGPFQGLSNTWFTSESYNKPRGTHSEGTKVASMGRVREQPARPAHTQTGATRAWLPPGYLCPAPPSRSATLGFRSDAHLGCEFPQMGALAEGGQ